MVSDCFSNLTLNSSMPTNMYQGKQLTMFELMQGFNDAIMEKFLWIGIFALAFGVWMLFKDPNKDDYIRQFVTNALNMMCIVAGITGIVLYFAYKYDLVKI